MTDLVPIDSDGIIHLSYSISREDLVQAWIDLMHVNDNIVIVYDPIKHIDYLKEIDIAIPANEIWESKILIIEVMDIDDAFIVLKTIDHKMGPYAQIWIQGRYITDNIDK